MPRPARPGPGGPARGPGPEPLELEDWVGPPTSLARVAAGARGPGRIIESEKQHPESIVPLARRAASADSRT